ncbi:conserved protein of unknown function (plasmid) [Cupriavidus taiwanensis]|uniref:DUF5131 family protein n=1 Tax=Cupriavidus taiwanensis TaxID=164546 RepID=A0A375IRZ5_9BURK|nr:conserved protein of unknown function [Cupriavidus taiwanensis]
MESVGRLPEGRPGLRPLLCRGPQRQVCRRHRHQLGPWRAAPAHLGSQLAQAAALGCPTCGVCRRPWPPATRLLCEPGGHVRQRGALEWFVDVLEVWRRTPNLDKLVLSKRIGNATRRLEAALEHLLASGDRDSGSTAQWLASWLEGNAPADIWLGATVVNQCEADRDIPKLMRVPASMRFLSMEPLLGHVDVFSVAGAPTMIDWVIAGGESGPGARPMHPDWPRSLRDQCAAAGVPFLFKQHGEWAPGPGDFGTGHYETAAVARDGRVVRGGFDAAGYPAGASSADGWSMVHRAGKRHAGRLLDGVQHDEFPISSADIAHACRQALYKETA